MKKLGNQTYKYICFEVARLRTRWDNDKENRSAIEKRYREVVTEFNSRTDNWFWTVHSIDKIIKEQAILEKMKKAKHSRTKCMECSKAPEVEVKWANGMAHAWFCNKCYGVWKKRKFELNGKAYTYGEDINKERKIDGEASKKWSEPIKKAEDWCSQKGGKWITVKGKHICIGGEKILEDGRKERTLIGPNRKVILTYSDTKNAVANDFSSLYNSISPTSEAGIRLKDNLKEVVIMDNKYSIKEVFKDLNKPIPEHYKQYAIMNCAGRYDQVNSKIVMYKGGYSSQLYHEFGHAIEPSSSLRTKDSWKKIWEEEKVSEYAKTSPSEGFAEAFRYYNTDHPYPMKKSYPKTFEFIKGWLRAKD